MNEHRKSKKKPQRAEEFVEQPEDPADAVAVQADLEHDDVMDGDGVLQVRPFWKQHWLAFSYTKKKLGVKMRRSCLTQQ